MLVKAPLVAVLLLVAGLLGIPVVIGGNGAPGASDCGEVEAVLATIRTIESGGDYAAPKNRGGASGAYQYIDSTWNGYEGYESAYLAPPATQDSRAASDVRSILERYGDVALVPVVWYWPRAATDAAQLDVVPMPGAGNRLTVREYQQKWLALYYAKAGEATTTSCGGATATADGYALPLGRDLIAADPTVLDQPHHDYPAIDLMVPEGSPVYAVRGGTVARVVDWPYNCYSAGRCDQTCGVGVSINGDDGVRYIYCHGSRLNGIVLDQTVTAGQVLMWSGNTGRSGAPHLHLEIRVAGEQRCPQRLLRSLFDFGAAADPSGLSAAGCTF